MVASNVPLILLLIIINIKSLKLLGIESDIIVRKKFGKIGWLLGEGF